MMPDRVPFGYREVSPGEKKRLVREQFDPIAGTYDLADAVLSAGLDERWRKKGISLLGLKEGDRVLDLCGGTGDFAILASARTGDHSRVVIYDFNRRMMEAGRRKIRRSPRRDNIFCIQGDAEFIAFADRSFEAVTLGFGLRNFVHPELGLKEIYRVLKTGGKLLVLEFSLPARGWLKSLYHFYSFRVMPLVGRIICGTAGPFRYLAESIRVFPPPEEVVGTIRRAGFQDVCSQRVSQGVATLYSATKEKQEFEQGD
jgi:demethylmenaquinone methyltransferase/2-methoxy-6-polyprenyl-1,4-benzoquinol methylase